MHASPTCVMSYGDQDECVGELIGSECAGMKAMFTMMNQPRLNVGSQGVQIGERATQQALAYAAERIQSAPTDGTSPQPEATRKATRSEEHTSELQSLTRTSYAA